MSARVARSRLERGASRTVLRLARCVSRSACRTERVVPRSVCRARPWFRASVRPSVVRPSDARPRQRRGSGVRPSDRRASVEWLGRGGRVWPRRWQLARWQLVCSSARISMRRKLRLQGTHTPTLANVSSIVEARGDQEKECAMLASAHRSRRQAGQQMAADGMCAGHVCGSCAPPIDASARRAEKAVDHGRAAAPGRRRPMRTVVDKVHVAYSCRGERAHAHALANTHRDAGEERRRPSRATKRAERWATTSRAAACRSSD